MCGCVTVATVDPAVNIYAWQNGGLAQRLAGMNLLADLGYVGTDQAVRAFSSISKGSARMHRWYFSVSSVSS